MVIGARMIRSEKLREYKCREGYARSLETKGVKWDGRKRGLELGLYRWTPSEVYWVLDG